MRLPWIADLLWTKGGKEACLNFFFFFHKAGVKVKKKKVVSGDLCCPLLAFGFTMETGGPVSFIPLRIAVVRRDYTGLCKSQTRLENEIRAWHLLIRSGRGWALDYGALDIQLHGALCRALYLLMIACQVTLHPGAYQWHGTVKPGPAISSAWVIFSKSQNKSNCPRLRISLIRFPYLLYLFSISSLCVTVCVLERKKKGLGWFLSPMMIMHAEHVPFRVLHDRWKER